MSIPADALALRRRVDLLKAESYLRIGDIHLARQIFDEVGETPPRHLLIACADALTTRGMLGLAYDTYATVWGVECIPNEKVTSLIAQALANGCFRFARDLNCTTGSEIPSAAIVSCAEIALQHGNIEEAQEAYRAARLDVPIGKVLAAADAALEKGSEGIARLLLEFAAKSSLNA